MDDFHARNGFITELVNSIPGVEDWSYLELGLKTGENFQLIRCREKVSVDVDPQWNAMYTMTTDRFFDTYDRTKSFDIVFIDACHEYQQVLRDYNHSALRCAQFIFLHDLYPSCAEYTAPQYSGDAYKLLAVLRNLRVTVYTADTDCGLSFVPMPDCVIHPEQEIGNFSYEEFTVEMGSHPRYTIEEMKILLKDMVS